MSAITHVVAGVSGSPRSLPALRHAAALARDHGATLVPLHIWVPPGGERANLRGPSRYLRQIWERDAWERLWDAVDKALGGVPPDVPTEPQVVRGEAGWVLVHAASRAQDLLVIGAGRRGAAGRLVGGKVSRYCLAHACCPVVAVPPSPLELEAGHGLHGWVVRHRGLSPRELAASANGNSAGPR
jgi:nucleotide-binding universal stress UspA family protein